MKKTNVCRKKKPLSQRKERGTVYLNFYTVLPKVKCKNPIFFIPIPRFALYFLLKEQPSVSLALPPVGWQRTVAHEPQMTTVWAWEKTVVMLKQPGHFTSMKNERGAGTRVCGSKSSDQILHVAWRIVSKFRTLSLCLRASAAAEGLRRSSART
jgi:hypothetical protein